MIEETLRLYLPKFSAGCITEDYLKKILKNEVLTSKVKDVSLINFKLKYSKIKII